MTNQVISNIVAAEQEAADIISKAQSAAREAALRSQEDSKRILDEKITKAKLIAKEYVLQKKNELDAQTGLLKQKNQIKYEQFLREAESKIQDAADFIAERILL